MVHPVRLALTSYQLRAGNNCCYTKDDWSSFSVLNGRGDCLVSKIRCLERNCLYCSKPFQAPVKCINAGGGKYCSISCAGYGRYKKPHLPNISCAYCQKEFWLSPSKLKKSKSGLYFCCRQHKDLASRIGGIEEIQPDHYGKLEVSDYRVKALRNYPAVCMRCGFDKFVVVHHKDRDRSNNDLSNLEILCPNCHAIEHWSGATSEIKIYGRSRKPHM